VTPFPFSGLRMQLAALVLIALIPMTALGIYVGLMERRQADTGIRRHSLDLVRLISAREGEQIAAIRQILPLLAERGAVADRSADCGALLAMLRAQSPYFANVGAADLKGDVYCSALPLQGRVNIADRGYFQHAVQAREFSAGTYQLGRVSGKASQNFGYPILNAAGAVQGVVFVALDLAWFTQVTVGTPLPANSALVVLDPNGTVLARYPDPARWIGNMAPTDALTRAIKSAPDEGTVDSSALDGVRRVYAFVPLGQGPDRGAAYIALGIPAAATLAEADRTLAGAFGVLIAVALLGFMVAAALGNVWVVRGINRLQAATTRLRAGDLTARAGPPYANGELGTVARAFDDMVRSLQSRLAETAKAQDTLRHSERRFRALIENSSDVKFLTDTNQTIVYASPASERVLGYAPAELVGRKIAEYQHPDDKAATAEVYSQLAAEPGARTSVTFRARHRGGSWRWIEGVATNLLEDPSVRAVVANFRDITARRRAEELLRRNERRFRALIEHSSDVTVLAGADGTMTYVSPPLARVLGYAPQDVVGQPIAALIHPDDAGRVMETFGKIAREPGGREALQARARHKDGSWRWIDAVGINLLDDPDVESVVGHFWDITTRRDAEEAVRRRAADLEALHALAEALRGAKSLPEMYDTLVDRSMAIFGAVHGAFALLSDDRMTFTRVCTRGVPEERPGSTFPAAGSLSGDVAARNISYATGNLAAEIQRRQSMPPDLYKGLGPFALVPLRSEEAILGTLVVARAGGPAEGPPFTQEDVRLLETIAEAAGSAMRRAQLYADLQRHATELEERVAERTTALRAAKEDADRASRAKSEFLSRMSHELRTPLNAVLGFAQLLEMDPLNTDQRENVDYILKGGHHLLNLINEVLDIARIEAGRLAVSPESVLLEHVMRETIDLMRPLAAESGATLTGDLERVRGRCMLADGGRLRQIVLNFVSNAIKYGGRGVTITVSCQEAAPGRLRMTVTDTGPGIPPDKAARLFVPFERLGQDETIEGTGLGLALSKGLAAAMNGTIGVETSVGGGSTFWVELPAAESPHKALETAPADSPDVAQPATVADRTVTVLYIEDNLSNFDLVKRVLHQYPQIRLLPAMQGRLGLDLALRHRPEVILLDLHLPDIPGSEVLARLREAPETRDIPVIMVTADATSGQAARLIDAGARAYLTKPLELKQFLTLIDELLAVPEVHHGSVR
jgi:PAS domain S-box-containing protein